MKSKKYNIENINVPRFNEENGFYTTKSRSLLMSKIKSKGTKPELLFRKALFSKGVRYRVNQNDLPGKPDVVIKKYNLAVFIDGEFWHGYNWDEKKNKIKSNKAFWIPKIERNMQRDMQNDELLKSMGFTVFRFWETQIIKNLEGCLLEVLNYLKK